MYKLLLVDDEAIIRTGISKMLPLERRDMNLIKACSNAFEALESMTDEMPDILISDIKMPQMDGLELAEKALEKYPDIQVILLSGFDEFEYARKALKLGVKEYLLKPCDSSELENALIRACQNIDEQRRKFSRSIGERESNIHLLTEQLMELARKDGEEQTLLEELKKLVHINRNEEIWVEALVRIVALAERKIASAQWQIELIQRIFNRSDDDILVRTAEILHQIYTLKETQKPFVESMIHYVKEHYMDSTLSLQFIADHVVHMNADYIGKEFAHDMGMKFSEYLLQVRMKHARKLISSNVTMPFYEVAELIGYGDNPQYFSLMFKKVSKLTPKEFRDSVIADRTNP